jgi:probable HAF family extracellular repeat protein
MKKRLNSYLAILAFVLSVASTAHAITYTFTEIDAPGASDTSPMGINNSGDIVGCYDVKETVLCPVDACYYIYDFLYRGGNFTTIDVPVGYFDTCACGINNSGDIVGWYADANGFHGGLYAGGKFTKIDVPGADTYLSGINDSGDIVGSYSDNAGASYHGFLYAGGKFTWIDFPGASSTSPEGINNSGDIVGWYRDANAYHGFLYAGGKFTKIDFSGTSDTFAYGINDSGDIVGWYDPPTPHGFLYRGGSFTTIDVPGCSSTSAMGINNSGTIVGYCGDFESGPGFLATPKNINISVTSSINFGNVGVGQSANQTITITNQANSTAVLTGNVGILSAPFSVVSGGGPFNLNPGQSLSVTVQFSPTTVGKASASLSITYNATNQTSPTNVTLGGIGVLVPAPNVVISSISGPSTGTPGGRISIQSTVTNQGTLTSSKETVNFYLSFDTKINTGDSLIGKRSIPTLSPAASSGPVSTTVTIPRNTAQGSYFIGGVVGDNANFDPKRITICLSLSKLKLLTPKNRGTNVSTTPVLSWSNVSGVSSYEVQVATDSGFTNIAASVKGLTNTQWTVAPTLSGGTTYFWRARAVNPCGLGPWSMSWSFKTT